MSLLRKVLEIVIEECEGKNAKSVRAVHLSIGELSDVIEDMVPGLFRHFARGTVAEDAEIVITRIPAYVRCTECGDIFHIEVRDPKTWECPRCHAYQKYRLFTGREFRVDRIDMEIPEIAISGELSSGFMKGA